MFGTTQGHITRYFNNQKEAKILALKQSSNSNVNKVIYLSTIQLPNRAINCSFECVNTSTKDSKNRNDEFETYFKFGDVILELNSDEDFHKLFLFLKKVSNSNGSTQSIINKAYEFLTEVESEFTSVKEEVEAVDVAQITKDEKADSTDALNDRIKEVETEVNKKGKKK